MRSRKEERDYFKAGVIIEDAVELIEEREARVVYLMK